ncbi:MAG: helix-turn-helix domain-containing protein [Myxococcota bacterium]|nr:helix-turn-helix domain-containing protein [Myxococcota bacterium]
MAQPSGPVRLRRFRASRGLSREKFARLLGISASMVTKMERGESLPSLTLAARIQRYTRDWDEGPVAALEWLAVEPAEAA